MKKCVSVFSVIVLIFLLSAPAYASEEPYRCIDITGTETTAQLMELLSTGENVILRGPRYHYKSVSGEEQEVTTLVQPVGQPTEGTYLSGYSSLGYYRFHGSTVTASVTVEMPDPLQMISLTINVDPGAMVSSGTGVVTNICLNNGTPGFYLLKVYRTVSIKPYTVYQKPAGAGDDEWTPTHSSYVMKNPCVRDYAFLDRVDTK